MQVDGKSIAPMDHAWSHVNLGTTPPGHIFDRGVTIHTKNQMKF